MLKVSDLAGAKGVLLAFLVGCFGEVLSQEHAISIRVRTAGGRPVENASVKIDKKEWGADSTGIAVLLLPKGNYRILISAVGHLDTVISLQVFKDIFIDIPLRLQDNYLQGVVVTANRNILRNQMSTHRLDISQIQKLPVILGEVDPLKTITLLPGIKNSGEAGAGIYVRGGGPDQNLVLLDWIQVYNPNHLLGFFSVFNGDAIKNVEVIKGGIPAEYGGRLSSV
ncbi:MAG TPA: TonB-dependent receptor plug domain-containing protein, partial [Pseudobacter sp.]|nr:TonB-dependent receptor plug domain-containing protein [Pseudobacter sp.]